MSAGFNGTTLAIFTSLAPAGMVAFFLLGLYALLREEVEPEGIRALNPWFAVPLTVTWLGFIASATHLGMPSNALYVVTGMGRSPLSNEVAAVVGFLFFSGLFWLYTFRLRYKLVLAKTLLAAAMLFAFAGVGFSSNAYAIGTIPSWDAWYTPANLWLSGLAGGGGLASATLIARSLATPDHKAPKRWHKAFLATATIAILASVAVLYLQVGYLEGLTNNVGGLVLDDYRNATTRHILECLAGISLEWVALRLFTEPKAQAAVTLAGLLLLGVGILVTRTAFYGVYLSVGF